MATYTPQKHETDARTAGTDLLVPTVGRRNDALASTGADGQYIAPTLDPAGIAKVAAFLQSDLMMAGVTQLTPQFAFVNVAASQTDSVIVAAVASKKIRVIALYMVTGGTATNVTFNSKPAGAGVAITALFANAANGGAILPFNPVGWFQTNNTNEGLTVTTGAGSTTGIGVVYVTV